MNNPKIFTLEDSQERIDWIKTNFNFADIDIAMDISEISNYKGGYNLLMLDHDLGDRQMVDSSDKNTGYEFCKWLVENEKNKEIDIVIHSHNPYGAKAMEDLLIEYGFKNVFQLTYGELVKMWNLGGIKICGKSKYN